MGEYVGLDVSKEETSFCVKEEGGRVLARGKAPSDPAALFEALREHCLCPQRIVLETGTMSGWLARELGKLGLPVEVIDARQAHAVMKLQHNKTDAGDAELLAEIARTGFYRSDCGQRGGAGGADPAQGARSPGAPTARHGERDPRASRVLGHALSQGLGQAGRPGARRPGRSSRVEGDDRAAVVHRCSPETRDRTAGPGGHGTGQVRAGVPALDERSGRRAGDGAGLRRDHRRAEPVRQIARGRGLSGADDAALSVRGNGLLGAHIEDGRRHVAEPLVRGRQQPVDGGAQGPSAQGLGGAGSGNGAATDKPAWRWRASWR